MIRRAISALIWTMVLLSAFIGAGLLAVVAQEENAIAQGAGAAIAVAIAALPYIGARAWDELIGTPRARAKDREDDAPSA